MTTKSQFLDYREADCLLTDFVFSDGTALEKLRLHYKTLGSLCRSADGTARNALLILHGTGGQGDNFLREQFAGELFGPGQLLDAERYFILLPDGIGHGGSSKPSDGLRAKFPRYGYGDMVRAQFRLLTEVLGIDHLRLVMGTSMGGMHTWMWGELHPGFVDALMPLASLPVEIAGRNRMLRRMIIDAICTDPSWEKGNYSTQPNGLKAAIFALLVMVSAPVRWQNQAPTRQQADALFDQMVATYLENMDANDLLYQVSASQDYNPEPGLEQIIAPLTAVNFADDQVNPPELGIMERLIGRVPQGEYVLIPTGAQSNGHRGHSLPKLWHQHLERLLERSGLHHETHDIES